MIDEITITSLRGRGSVTMKNGDWQGYWLGEVDTGQVTGEHQTYSFPDQVGEDIIATAIGKRALSITGWVLDAGTHDLRARCDFLNAFISPAEDYELEVYGKKIRFRPDSSIYYPPNRDENNDYKRKFLIQATLAYPLFSDRTDTIVSFDATGKLFRFPTGFGREAPLVFGTQNRTYTVEANNPGGFETGILARFSFTGTVDSPQVSNLTTEKADRVNRVFSRGERLEICTFPGRKAITLITESGERQNLMKYRDFRNKWVKLVPGRNLLALGCKDLGQRASMSVTVAFTPLYMEVQ